MHDAGGDRTQTIAVLPLIVAGLRKHGYTLFTVPRLILDDPPQQHPASPLQPRRRLTQPTADHGVRPKGLTGSPRACTAIVTAYRPPRLARASSLGWTR
jgi:hypothetical protein